ncbi:MAG: peptidoglycan-binding protein [Acidobacteria bacterium]|nr:peptidoglycan-binding protein [Acidobacteriota bacterium]
MPEEYVIQPGDCVSSIAFDRGFFWETLWNHPKNAELKQKRTDPNILKEGDVLFIPDKELKEESCATDQKHKFKIKGVPAKLKLKVMEPPKAEDKPAEENATGADDGSHVEDPDYNPEPIQDEPVKNAPFRLEIDGKVVKEGSTDGEGQIEVELPPNAREGRLVIRPGTPEERVLPLNLGGMDPISEISGVRMRLSNLGFPCASTGDELTDDLASALRMFQQNNELDVTGKIDAATKDKLKQLHGS